VLSSHSRRPACDGGYSAAVGAWTGTIDYCARKFGLSTTRNTASHLSVSTAQYSSACFSTAVSRRMIRSVAILKDRLYPRCGEADNQHRLA
jgi:hypothetical protein